MRALLERILHEEDGNTILVVLGFLPVVIGLAALVIDLGNGFTHRRHLQTQADAGVFAAGPEFFKCGASDKAAANEAIESAATDYALNRNPQVGGADASTRVSAAVNATGYDAADESDGTPCDTGYIDLKLTDKNIPPFIALTGDQTVRAHARLQAFQGDSLSGLTPIAAEDPDPRAAKVYFVDESNGSVLAERDLKSNGTADGLAIWDNSAEPVSVPIDAGHIGVRVAVSGSTSTTCGEPLVQCYDADSANGLVHIQGWSSAGTVTQKPQQKPLLRSVTLYNGTCVDPYFSAASAGCTIGVEAVVDWGGDPAIVGGALTASVPGATYDFPEVSYDPQTGISRSRSGGVIPIQPGADPVEVQLDWKATKGEIGRKDCTKGQGCTGSFGVVQRTFPATDSRSGPIQLVQVSKEGSIWSNSLELGTTSSLVVKVGIKPSFGIKLATGAGDSVSQLRVVSGSQTQSLDCDPGLDLKLELADGCAPSYAINTGTDCPSDSLTLWASAAPWRCVGIKTGAVQNGPAAGLNQRILCKPTPDNCLEFGKPSDCSSPNDWSSYPNIDPADPRIVAVMLTPYNSFGGSGSHPVPVTGFASFYITGWTGQGEGFANPCQSDGDDPAPDEATIVGHFIKYVQPDQVTVSDKPCDFSALAPCGTALVE